MVSGEAGESVFGAWSVFGALLLWVEVEANSKATISRLEFAAAVY